MLVVFQIERDFCIISEQETYEQVKNFFNPANTQSSSEESLKEKRMSPFHLVQYTNTELTQMTYVYLQSSQISKMERFAKIVNG